MSSITVCPRLLPLQRRQLLATRCGGGSSPSVVGVGTAGAERVQAVLQAVAAELLAAHAQNLQPQRVTCDVCREASNV
jgi:hypothetical protein